MFCENGNAALRIEPVYGSMLPYVLRFRCFRAPLQEDIRSHLDVAHQLMAANGTLVSHYRSFQPKPEANTTSYQYDRDNQPTRETRPEGSVAHYNYNPTGKIATTTDAKDQQARYTYNDAGNIDTKQSEHGLYDYSYDSLDRLTQADNPTLPNEAYTYDGVGNRMTDNSKPGTWSYNTDNQLTNIDNQTNFTYDANGSLVQKTDNGVTTEYQYNIENRLMGITRNGSTVASYYYDPFGRRLWKETNGQRTYFFYAEEGIIAEFDSSGTPIRQYGYKPNSLWGTDPIFQKAGGQYYFYQNDHLGTSQKLVKANGAVVWSAKYQAFGDAQLDGSYTIENPLRFPGQYYDKETGLHYNYFRYYDPSAGRYLTPEPLGILGLIDELDLFEFQGGDANAYVYTLNNPLFYVDEDGAARKKYQKPQNPNKRRGADQRRPGGQRERNVRHPDAEEHSRRPKGIPKLPRIPGLIPLICPLCEILKIPEPEPVPPLCQR